MLSRNLELELERDTLKSVAERFAQTIVEDPNILRSELTRDGPLSRKKFCEFLDVGESTLTGWLQGKVPKSAAVAYALLLVGQRLQQQMQDLQRDMGEPRVVEMGGTYSVIMFDGGDAQAGVGRVVAHGVPTLEIAHQIRVALSQRMRNLLERQADLLDARMSGAAEAGNGSPSEAAGLKQERDALDPVRQIFTAGQSRND